MNTRLLVPEFRPDLNYLVPFSELAMHLKIAGRHITYAHISGRVATIRVDGNWHEYSGLISELMPFELRKESTK